MDIRKLIIVLLGLIGFYSCDKSNLGTADNEALKALLIEIEKLSSSFPCEEASEWRFTPLGAKPCGGPALYIAYSIKVDTVQFLSKVKNYTEKEKDFNLKTGAVSDCAVVEEPQQVICKDGKPEFSYRLE